MRHPSPTGLDAAPRRWPIRLILVGVVFALVLPGLMFAGVLVDRITRVQRARSEEAATATALRAADVLDRELANLSAALIALSTSPSLATGDLAAFDQQARTVAEALNQVVVVSDPEGNQLINTRLPPGTALPRMSDSDTVRAAIATGQTVTSNLFMGRVSGVPSVMVMRVARPNGRPAYVLAITLESPYLSKLLTKQGLPPGWVASVTDGTGRIIARSVEAPTYVGQAAPAGLSRRPAADHDLRILDETGAAPALVATQQLRQADWRVSVNVSMHTVQAPLRETLRWLAGTGALALAIATLMAWQLARSVAAPLHRLSRAGAALAAGLPVLGVRSGIAEVDSVSRTLVQATQDLRDRAAALVAERAQLAAVIETVPVGLVIADATGRVLAGNSRLDVILRHGLKRSSSPLEYGEWIAHHPDGRLVQPAEYPVAQVLNEGRAAAELRCLYQRGDGTEFWVQIVAAPILDPDGVLTGSVAAILDIDEVVRAQEAEARFAGQLEHQVAERTAVAEAATQRLRDEMAARAAAEEQLHQAQKMEAVGQLTGGIAHDFNNLLTIVIGSLDLLRRRAGDDRTRRLLDNALEGATRAATLTARLLAFSRRQPLLPQAVDVNRLVTGMSDLLHRTLGEAIQLETILAGGVWQTHADPNQLENALLNLAVNSRDAIVAAAAAAAATPGTARPPSRLVIATGNTVLDPGFAPHDPEFQPGDYVRISVTDTGTGMSPEVVARVFEPFYTTKPQGQGTGLGLSQVHGFVKQSGGHVTISTKPGEGTTVGIHLPRLIATPPLVAEPEPEPEPATACTGLTVLVVEDDAGVRRFSVEALRELGHVVLETGVCLEALRLLDSHPEIDLLLTDIVLPVMNGPRLADEARRRRPDLPVLFASGYTGHGAMNEGLLPPGAPLLQKPYTLQVLAAKLREVLNPDEPAAGAAEDAPGRT